MYFWQCAHRIYDVRFIRLLGNTFLLLQLIAAMDHSMIPLSLPGRRSRASGFTLTEAAVVLGVVGLVLGSIWATAGNVMANNKAVTFSKQFDTIVRNVARLYPTAASVGSSANSQAEMIRAGVFPPNMIDPDGATLRDPYGNTLTVAAFVDMNNNRALSIIIPISDSSSCIRKLNNLAGVSSDIITLYSSTTVIVDGANSYDDYLRCQAAGMGDPPCSINYSWTSLAGGTTKSAMLNYCGAVVENGGGLDLIATYK